MTETHPETRLTPKPEAAFIYQLGQEVDWRPTLLCQYVTSQGSTLPQLKTAILEQDPDQGLVLLTLYITSQGKEADELRPAGGLAARRSNPDGATL